METEIQLGFTLDPKRNLDEFVGDARSCVNYGDPIAIHQLVTGEITANDVNLQPGEVWQYPAGAFKHSAARGPC